MCTILLFGGGCIYPEVARAQSADAQVYAIPAGDLNGVLRQFSQQSRVQLIYPTELVDGKRSAGLSGSHTAAEGLRRLLDGSGLESERVNDKTIVLRRAPASPTAEPPPQAGRTPAPAPADSSEPKVQDLQKMMVTGTRIRGGSTPSPVIMIGSERIREEGFTDLGEVIRSIPQNFRGGQNPGVPAGNLGLGLTNQNVNGGSGLNLRGLGPDATLTLFNGRRLSYSGLFQSLDISAIPVEAVDRVDIVPDGASAIYGSDAVGGVGNVILRRDFDGLKVGARYGGATGGGLATREYTATAGHNWSSGGFIMAYKHLSGDPIYARQRSYTRYLPDPTMIYPSNDFRSALLSLHQSLGQVAELKIDALRARRDQTSIHFLNNLPQYYRPASQGRNTWISPSLDFFLPKDWTLSLGATWGEDQRPYQYTLVSLLTGSATVATDYCHCNELRTYEVNVEGPVFSLPGGDARLAAGAGYRVNEFNQIVTVGSQDIHADETSRFAYAEISLPLVGAESNVRGVNRLSFTAAARSEDYDSFGRVTTPKLGVIYGPSEDFSVKGSWGKSFKAPTLFQAHSGVTGLLYPAAFFGATGYPAEATTIYLQGGNSDLKPERARTWNASLAFHPKALPDLQAELTWFDIDYTDRVVFPFADVTQGLSDPVYGPFVEYSPTADTQSRIIAGVDNFINGAGAPYDPANVVAILHGRFTNVVRQRIRGMDLSGSYRFDLGGAGRLAVRGSASWLDSTQQSSPGQANSALSGTLFNPAKLNGRLGAVWSRDGLTVSAFANHTGGVTDKVHDQDGGSFTSFDATLRYATGPRGDGWSGLEVALSAQNLFDREPPFYTPANLIYSMPYDPTNYSAIGRFLSLSVSKHW